LEPFYNPWFSRPFQGADHRVRLLCFPPAGGIGTIFHTWAKKLSKQVEVLPAQLPGHIPRHQEAPLTDVNQIAEGAFAALESLPPLPTALFGHSFGGLLAFEVARRMQASGNPAAFVCLSASRAAHLPFMGKPLHKLPDGELVDEIGKLNGTPPEVLAHAEMMSLLLPAIRADFTALETYQYQAGPKLTCPVHAVGGRRDEIAVQTDLEAWKEHTTSRFQLHMLDDGHHLLDRSKDALLNILNKAITELGLAVL